jgi:hypothetical protein
MPDPSIVLDNGNASFVNTDVNFTKKQIYAKAVRGELTAQGRTTYASQNKFGTNANVYNLQKIPNSNILFFTRASCN